MLLFCAGANSGSVGVVQLPRTKLTEYEELAVLQLRGALPIGVAETGTQEVGTGHAVALALSASGPGGSLVVAAGCSTNSVLLLDVDTFEPLLTQPGLPAGVTKRGNNGASSFPTIALDTHPTAPYFATASTDGDGMGILCIWSLENHRLLASTTLSVPATAVAISGPQGDDILVGLGDGSLVLIDMRPNQANGEDYQKNESVKSGGNYPSLIEKARRQDFRVGGVAAVTVSPDGSFAAAASSSGEIWLYSLRSELSKAIQLCGSQQPSEVSGGSTRLSSRHSAASKELRTTWQLDFSNDSQWLHSSCATTGGRGMHRSDFWSVVDGTVCYTPHLSHNHVILPS